MKKVYFLMAGCIALMSCNSNSGDQNSTKDTSATAQVKPVAPTEIGDSKYSDMVKKSGDQLLSGDVDGWMTQYADSAVYRWSSGDSLHGKAAIAKYWKDRRANVIDSLSYLDRVYLSVKVNQPTSAAVTPGNWVLEWLFIKVKYKTKKQIMFWEHIDYHFDANDKVDGAIVYVDRAPIYAATKK